MQGMHAEGTSSLLPRMEPEPEPSRLAAGPVPAGLPWEPPGCTGTARTHLCLLRLAWSSVTATSPGLRHYRERTHAFGFLSYGNMS